MKPLRPAKTRLSVILFLLVMLLAGPGASAQYFGKNKVLYRNFDFSILQSQHFEIYNYLRSDSAGNRFSQLAEQWYNTHLSILGDSFRHRKPIVLYDNHAHFQLTRAIDGMIDVG